MHISKLKIRRSEENTWGFVESFKTYFCEDTGSITVLVCINNKGEFAEPYVLRGNHFIKASQIDSEMGISKYINAKKPFYSMLSDGFVAQVKVALNTVTNEIIPERSGFTVYKADSKNLETDSSGELNISRVIQVPKHIDELMVVLQKDLALCKGDREAFLKSRFRQED